MAEKMALEENGKVTSAVKNLTEEKLAEFAAPHSKLKDKTPEEIIHELRVAQIELEMQQDEINKTQLALEDSRDHYQELYDFAPVGYLTLTPRGVIKQVNLSLATLLGVTRQKLVNRGFGHFVDDESLGQFDIHITSVLKQKEKLSCNLSLKREDGSSLYVKLQSIRKDGSTDEEETSRTRGILTSVTDITERKRAEENLKKEKDKFMDILHAMNDGVYVGNAEHDIEYINPVIEGNFGTVDGRKCYEYFHDLKEPCPWCKNEEVFAGRSVQWECSYHKTGKTYDLFDTPLRNQDGSISKLEFFHDISDRKRAQEASQRSEKFLEQVVENIPDMIFVKDAENLRFVRFNKAGEDLLGYSREDLLGKSDYDLFPAAQADSFVAKDRSVLAEGKLLDISEEEISTKNRGKRILHTKKIPIIDSDGTAQFLLVISEDITERKQFEESHELLSTAIEQAAEAVIITDANGIIQYVNPAEEILSGYSSDELIGQTPNVLNSYFHPGNFTEQIWDTIGVGKAWSGRFVNKKKDGTEYHEDATISPIYDHSRNLTNFVVVQHDVTKQVTLQELLLQAQKMEAIGTLAGGFAHDFNNKLQIIDGYVDLTLFDKDLPETLKQNMRIIKQAVDSSAELIKGMMVFSRKTPIELQTIDLNKLVAQTRSMLARSISKMIEIDLLLAEDLWPINAAPNQIDQILMNLSVNARDAMPDGGNLTIQTQNTMLDEEYCRYHPNTKPGRYVLLSVTDTGGGMNRETASRIFEPFFTTKGPGKGTGLGLSVVYGIVEQHGGRIISESKPSEGTTFKIYFPAIEEVHEEEYFENREPPRGQGETILLVDDEPHLVDIVSRRLVSANYSVIKASNGNEALNLYEKQRAEIRLVILDLVMPGMSGKQCLEALRKLDPNVRVLVASGALNPEIEADLKEIGARGLIAKPFETSQLLEKIREIIDE